MKPSLALTVLAIGIAFLFRVIQVEAFVISLVILELAITIEFAKDSIVDILSRMILRLK